MLTVSTGFKVKLLGGEAFADVFHNSVILLFANTRPASPDMAPGASPTAMITVGGGPFALGSPINGLNWSLSTSGFLVPSTPDWMVTASVDTTLVWGRLCQNNDDQFTGFDFARFDFGVNSPDGYGLNVTNPVFTAGDTRTVDFALYGIPPL